LNPCVTRLPAAPAIAAQPIVPTPTDAASQPANTAVDTTSDVIAAA
jgi:hypothetical protein